MIKLIKKFLRPIKQALFNKSKSTQDHFLKNVSGVIHVGANSGQERAHYDSFGLKTLWVEPIPSVFAELVSNIQSYPKQRALEALVTDRDDQPTQFHISSNFGASSSLLDLKEHELIWPEVKYTKTIQLTSVTLETLLKRENIEPNHYQALIMDTQGSELLVLKGAIGLLSGFTYIKTEVPDFESYKGCCQLPEVSDFMQQHGFEEWHRNRFAGKDGVGNYYDIVYKRSNSET